MVNLPKESRTWASVRADLEHPKSEDHPWKKGRTPLYIYYKSDELLRQQCEAFGLYMAENVHGSKTVFPSVARLEREVCEMSLGLFNAPGEAAASFTSGGTESIFHAVKTARDWARRRYHSPTFAGSRPAGAVAAAWAMMQTLGRDGYLDLAASTMRARDRLLEGAARIDGIRCISPCELSIVLIAASDDQTDMDVVAAELTAATAEARTGKKTAAFVASTY